MESLGTVASDQPQMIEYWTVVESKLAEDNQSDQRKTSPSATSSTTNPI
jgi:hypothetical protein